MKFAAHLSLRNIIKKPFRAIAMALLVLLTGFTIFGGAVTILGLRKGLASYRARLGADIVVVPYSATSHGAVDDILLSGITGNYYLSKKQIEKIAATEGIAAISTQFYLTSAKASCCSSRVQIIGFDPETDFVIQPWINESYAGTLQDGEIIAGANISVPEDRMVTFYGRQYRVAAQLAETGTGLDSAVYTNMATVKVMAEDAKTTLLNDAFDGVNISTSASAVMIRVADGYDISAVADDINIHISKVEASSSKSMIASITSGLETVSGVIGGLVAGIWVLSVAILVGVFALVANERRKEFAILRLMGASKQLLTEVIGVETAMVSGVGSILGLVLALLVMPALEQGLKNALSLPVVMPSTGMLVLLGVAAVVLSVLAGLLAAGLSARRMTKSESGLLLREDT